MGFHGLKTHDGYIQGSQTTSIPRKCNAHVNWHGNSSCEVTEILASSLWLVVRISCRCCIVAIACHCRPTLLFHHQPMWHLLLMWKNEGEGSGMAHLVDRSSSSSIRCQLPRRWWRWHLLLVRFHSILYTEDKGEVKDRHDTTGMNVVWRIR